MIVSFDRNICGTLAVAESREWLVTNGLGGFASGTVAGLLTRRYHGLLMAALSPPLGRTLLVSKLEDYVQYDGLRRALSANRWADGTIAPQGFVDLERFWLEGTTPVWEYACADAGLNKRVWMERGANTTYVRYEVVRARRPVTLELAVLVNYRDYHATVHGGGPMTVDTVPHGLRIVAFPDARPFVIKAEGAEGRREPEWYYGFRLAREEERGLEALEDHLRAGTLWATVEPGTSLTIVLSAEPAPSLDGEAAWRRHRHHEQELLRRWRSAHPSAPEWVEHLVLAADQFVVRRVVRGVDAGLSVIAGYHWFGEWGRDTMIALPGLALTTGRPEVARSILTTFARFVDQGMLPNRLPDAGEAPEYNTADAALWYVEAVRAYHAATGDDGLLKELSAVLESIMDFHRRGTRYGIGEDPADGLLRAGERGVQLTWMDAKVGDWVVTPRIGKPIEVNALWFNALSCMAAFAERLGQPGAPWRALAARVRASFARFWNERAGYCYDVIDGPDGNDDALRPNQIFAVSLPESPLTPAQQRGVVDACARHLFTSYGLRSLAPEHSQYHGRYEGGVRERDAAYHQGTVWGWLLGPFALAQLRVRGDAEATLGLLAPMGHHLAEYGVGSLGEIFDGDPPFSPRGCIAQAWTVAETLRAWHEIVAQRRSSRPKARRRRRPEE